MVKYDRITALAKENGVSKAHLCSLLGWDNRHYLRDCEKSNKQLSDGELSILARALRTSVNYLTGKSEEKNPVSESGNGIAHSIDSLDADLQKQLIDFVALAKDNPDSAKRFLAFAAQELRSAKQDR